MILVVDNYDSFTYNLVQYIGESGETVEVYRNDELSVAEIIERNPAKIVISPGPGTPDDAGVSVPLIHAVKGTIPLLGGLSGASVYRCRSWWKSGSCSKYHAWQNLTGLP